MTVSEKTYEKAVGTIISYHRQKTEGMRNSAIEPLLDGKVLKELNEKIKKGVLR